MNFFDAYLLDNVAPSYCTPFSFSLYFSTLCGSSAPALLISIYTPSTAPSMDFLNLLGSNFSTTCCGFISCFLRISLILFSHGTSRPLGILAVVDVDPTHGCPESSRCLVTVLHLTLMLRPMTPMMPLRLSPSPALRVLDTQPSEPAPSAPPCYFGDLRYYTDDGRLTSNLCPSAKSRLSTRAHPGPVRVRTPRAPYAPPNFPPPTPPSQLNPTHLPPNTTTSWPSSTSSTTSSSIVTPPNSPTQ